MIAPGKAARSAEIDLQNGNPRAFQYGLELTRATWLPL